MDIKKVAVIGAGTMGSQIAMQTAVSGYNTVCYSPEEEPIIKAQNFAGKWFKKQIVKGKMTEEEAIACQKRLEFTMDMEKAAVEADFVIEAVVDILEAKRNVLRKLDEYTPDYTIYASNSSYIVSSKLCDAVKRPENVLNVHFFNPALVMNVVEIVKGKHVSQETFDTAYKFVESINKTPVPVEVEMYGFIVNRIFSALTREACYLVDIGAATPEDIDIAVKGGLGHPMGPFELLDMTGIDLEYDVYMEKFRNSKDMADRPAICLTEHYNKGEYGRKSGKGFYSYDK